MAAAAIASVVLLARKLRVIQTMNSNSSINEQKTAAWTKKENIPENKSARKKHYTDSSSEGEKFDVRRWKFIRMLGNLV